VIPPGARARALAALRHDPRRAAILLDFDGTLSAIADRPDLARIAPGVRDALARLVPAYALVAVVSGRPAAEVGPLVGVEGVRIEGLYGMDGRPGATAVPGDVVAEIERVAVALPGSVVERKGATVALHVRGTADPDAAEASAAAALGPLASAAGMRLLTGKRVLELVPNDASLKDRAVRRLIDASGAAAALYAGDDAADLDAFTALDDARVDAVKVAVRGPETPASVVAAADVVVDGPDGMADLLNDLIP
jgi:trehalose 6-phosphate phosphatase